MKDSKKGIQRRNFIKATGAVAAGLIVFPGNVFGISRLHSDLHAAAETRVSNYQQFVRTTLNTLIEHGRDRYGKEHSPLFAAILTQDTLECPREPPMFPSVSVRIDAGRMSRRAPGSANQFYDQATFRTMDLMTMLTGDQKYRNAVLDALRFNLTDAIDRRGFPALGGHISWNLYTDRINDQDGDYHELWFWPMAWDLWWAADSDKARAYADKIWEYHVVDKTTGETNRHSDKQHGWSFSWCDGTLMSAWSYAAMQTGDPKYHNWCRKVVNYHWQRHNSKTGLLSGSGGEYGQSIKRYDTTGFTTTVMPWARNLLEIGQQLGDEEMVSMGRTILDAYAQYGYNSENGLFYAQLTLEGKPVRPDARREFVDGKGEPEGYLATWLPDAGWHEMPLYTAQIYAWAAEHVDRDAYLPTAQQFGRILTRAWEERYAGFDDWFAFRNAVQPFARERYKNEYNITHMRHVPSDDVDKQLLEHYRWGDYVYQAPFGLFADHYGRMIQFCCAMHRLTQEPMWRNLAHEVANEAVRYLWRDNLFVGHPDKTTYENSDQVGILLHALLELKN